MLEDSFAYISPHCTPPCTLPQFTSLFLTLDLSFKVPSPNGSSISLHPNPHTVDDNGRTAELDVEEGKIRVLYECDCIIVARRTGVGISITCNTDGGHPNFGPSSISPPPITVPSITADYKISTSVYTCRRNGEICMSENRWVEGMNWYRRGEYNAIGGGEEFNPGVDKHAQAACLR